MCRPAFDGQFPNGSWIARSHSIVPRIAGQCGASTCEGHEINICKMPAARSTPDQHRSPLRRRPKKCSVQTYSVRPAKIPLSVPPPHQRRSPPPLVALQLQLVRACASLPALDDIVDQRLDVGVRAQPRDRSHHRPTVQLLWRACGRGEFGAEEEQRVQQPCAAVQHFAAVFVELFVDGELQGTIEKPDAALPCFVQVVLLALNCSFSVQNAQFTCKDECGGTDASLKE